jgi:DNA-binding NarL/FixJ family response regulator
MVRRLMQSFKTLIIDDEWLVRAELKTMLTDYPEIAVVGEAANVAQAIPHCCPVKA